MNKVTGKLKISYLLVLIFERPLNIPKRPSTENIGIVYNYGPGVRGTNAQRNLCDHSRELSFLFEKFRSSNLIRSFVKTFCKAMKVLKELDESILKGNSHELLA